MTKKKLIVTCLVVAIISVVLIVASLKLNEEKTADIIQLIIYPTNIYEGTYYYSLSEDGVLQCTMGERRNNDVKKKNNIKKVEYSSEKVLNEKDVQILIDLANELEDSGFQVDERRYIDTTIVVLLYNGNVYKMNYFAKDSHSFRQLADKIIELSPIPVKTRSYA